MGELNEDVVESAGDAPGDAVSRRMDDVPREGDFQRYFSAKEGPRRSCGRWDAWSSASAMRRNCASLMTRRSKLSKLDMIGYRSSMDSVDVLILVNVEVGTVSEQAK